MLFVYAMFVGLAWLRPLSSRFEWPLLRMLSSNPSKFSEEFKRSVATVAFVKVEGSVACLVVSPRTRSITGCLSYSCSMLHIFMIPFKQSNIIWDIAPIWHAVSGLSPFACGPFGSSVLFSRLFKLVVYGARLFCNPFFVLQSAGLAGQHGPTKCVHCCSSCGSISVS